MRFPAKYPTFRKGIAVNAIVFAPSVHINFHKNETDDAVKADKRRGETETMEAGKEATAPKPRSQKTRSDPQSMELPTGKLGAPESLKEGGTRHRRL